MTAQIRPNRMQVNDRFPILGFSIKTSRPQSQAEVVLATNIRLFAADQRDQRTAANFYTSREHGMLSIPRGEGVFVVPPEILARFIGQDKLFFALATGSAEGGALEVDAVPREGSPYVSLSGFTGRSLRRNFGGNVANTTPIMEWTGDRATPGAEPTRRAPSASPANGRAEPNKLPDSADYDDGFGDLPELPSREQAARAFGDDMHVDPAMDGAGNQAVMPYLPGQSRERAKRIGGPFADRIGQALDLGLPETQVTSLLDVLDPPLQAEPQMPSNGNLADPMNYRGPVAMSTPSRSINWDGVELLAQPTPLACWATTLAMLVGWRDGVSMSPEQIADLCGHDINQVLPWSQRDDVAAKLNLNTHPPQSFPAESFWDLIADFGPLYVGKSTGSATGNTHAVLVVGMYELDGQYHVRYLDPAHGGSRSSMDYARFSSEYELGARGNADETFVQILSPGIPQGRTANTSTASAPEGFAMGHADCDSRGEATRLAPAPQPHAHVMDGGATATVAIAAASFVIDSIASNEGDVSWELDQLRGWKHPNDQVPQNRGTVRDGQQVSLNDWPVAGGLVDDISAWFKVNWQYDGRSLGNVRVDNMGVNDAVGWGLHVTEQIMHDNMVHHSGNVAALKLTFHYRFSRTIGSEVIARRIVKLYGDGTYEVSGDWIQASALSMGSDNPHSSEEAALPPAPPPRSRAMDGGGNDASGNAASSSRTRTSAGVAAGRLVLTKIRDNRGDVSWELDQFREIKHPGNIVPSNPAPFQNAAPIMLNDWPTAGGLVDDINAWFQIDWQYNGTSLGNVSITNIGVNDAVGWGLSVRARIMDDDRSHGSNGAAGLRLTFTYRFTRTIGSDVIAERHIQLYGDGTFEVSGDWIQASALEASDPALIPAE